jgi:hypothetical protein
MNDGANHSHKRCLSTNQLHFHFTLTGDKIAAFEIDRPTGCPSSQHTPTTKDGLEPFHATGTSRCEYHGSGPLDRSACSDIYGSFSLLNL